MSTVTALVRSLSLALFPCAVVACAPTEHASLGEARAAIIFGAPDTENLATVYVDGPLGSCSGTIVAKQGRLGYVLTAAHCGALSWVGIADDMKACTGDAGPCLKYPVVGAVVHPSFVKGAPSTDYQVLTIDGVDDATPVIPIARTPDGLEKGTTLELSGYGFMNDAAGNLVRQSLRRRTTTQITTLQPSGFADGTTIAYAQSFDGPGGQCRGDSGGSAYLGSGAQKRLVGVIEAGDAGCEQIGLLGRVSAVADFVDAVIAGTTLPASKESCDTCAARARETERCAAPIEACGADLQCVDLDSCWYLCDTDACRRGCLGKPGGTKFQAYLECSCGPCAAQRSVSRARAAQVSQLSMEAGSVVPAIT
ncbi:MAG: trypsin-like serine protease, partial [Polyangiaceae bacterium]|nr:trypsin-like serine protease [Polyangiaceae bacterium]